MSRTGTGTGWRNTLAKWVVLSFLLELLFFAGCVAATVSDTARSTEPTRAVSKKPTRPDVSKCPEDISLWECIRTVAYERGEAIENATD